MESDEELDFGEDDLFLPAQPQVEERAPPPPPPSLPAPVPTPQATTTSAAPPSQPTVSRENGTSSSSAIPTQPSRPRSTDADRFAPSARTQDRYASENRSRDRRDNGGDSTRSPHPAPSRSDANSHADSPNRRPSPSPRSAQPSRPTSPQPPPPRARSPTPTPPPQPKPPHNPRLDANGHELPQDWESRISASQGDTYYKNLKTGETSWSIPEQAKEASEPAKEQSTEQLPPPPVKKIAVHPDRARLVTPFDPQSITATKATAADGLASRIEGSTVSATEDPDSRTDSRWAKGPASPATPRSLEQSRKALPPQQEIFGPGGRDRGPRGARDRPERGAPGLSNANLVAVAPRRPSSGEAIPTGPKALVEIPTGPRGPIDAPTGPRGNKRGAQGDVASKWAQPGGARPVPPPPPPSAPAADRRALAARAPQEFGSAGMKRIPSASHSSPVEAGPRFAPPVPSENRWAAPAPRRDAPKPFAPPTAPRALVGRGRPPPDAKDLDASLESYVTARSPGSHDGDYRPEPTPVPREPEPVVEEKPAPPAPAVEERQSFRDLPPHQQPADERRRPSVSPPRALPPHLRNALPRASRPRPRSPPRERSPPPSNDRSPPPHLARQRSPPNTSARVAAVEASAAVAGASANQWGPRAARAMADKKEREERGEREDRSSDRRDREVSSSDRRDREVSSSDRRERDDGGRSRDRDLLPPRRRSPTPTPPPRRRSRSPRRRDEYSGRDWDVGKPRKESYTIREGPRYDVDSGRRVADTYRPPPSPPRQGGMANGLRGRFRIPDDPIDSRRSPPPLSPPSRSSGLPPSYLLPANPTNSRRRRSLSPPLRLGPALPAGSLPARPRQRSRSRSPGRGGKERARSPERSVQEKPIDMPLLRFGKTSGPAAVGLLSNEDINGNSGGSLAARLSSLPDRPTNGNGSGLSKRSRDSVEPERRRDDRDDRARGDEGEDSEDWDAEDGLRSRMELGGKRRRPGGRGRNGRKR